MLALSQMILRTEKLSRPQMCYNSTVVTLATLLRTLAASYENGVDTHTPLSFLLSIFCPADIAHAVRDITNAISFSTEINSPWLIQSTLRRYPELAIVQDAHRLALIGTIRTERKMNELEYHLLASKEVEKMMKTREGKRIATLRIEELEILRRNWEQRQGMKGWKYFLPS